MKHLISLFAMLIALSASAATANIDKLWLEHGVKEGGRFAIKVHCKFNIKNAKNENCTMNAWVKGPSGNWHNIKGNAYSTTNTPYIYTRFCPGYDDTVYNDLTMTILTDDLNMLQGKNTYSLVVTLSDSKGRALAQSDAVNFTGTGPERSNNNSGNYNNNNRNNNNNSSRNNANDVVQTWRVDLTGGGYIDYTRYANGSLKSVTSTPCMFCHATGICGICGGTGGTYNAYTGIYYPCSGCLQTGVCHNCNGTKVHQVTTWVDATGSNAVSVGSDGTVVTNTGGNRSGSGHSHSSSNRNSNSNSSTCPNCGGTGVEKFPMYVNDPSGALANTHGQVGYTHLEGSKCKYCGKWEYHVHLKCYKCR